MKYITYYIVVIALLAFTPHGTGTYTVNNSESSVVWKGEKMTGNHVGNIQIKTGTISFDQHLIKSGSIVLDMNSINCTDLEGDTKKDFEDSVIEKLTRIKKVFSYKHLGFWQCADNERELRLLNIKYKSKKL